MRARLSAAEPFLDKTDLFEAGSGGYVLYRIPGIVVTAKGTVLAYCEARQSGGGDWAKIDVLMRLLAKTKISARASIAGEEQK